jgi:uncharacterized repeat protein (TIGR03803 family)
MKQWILSLSVLTLAGCGGFGAPVSPNAAGGSLERERPMRATESVLHSFGGADGAGPLNGLISDGKGGFYGTTVFGGPTGGGEIFRLRPHGSGYTESAVYGFAGGNDGDKPEGITEHSGAFYGVTFVGGGSGNGGNGWGTVYQLTYQEHTYKETVLYRFQGFPDGGEPIGPVVLDRKGNIIGVASMGGSHNQGAIFQLTPSASGYTESVLYSFPGGAGGNLPQAGVTIDKQDAIYGTTMYGGSYDGYCSSGGCGIVFKLTPHASGYSESIAYAFKGSDGNLPYGVPTVDDRTGTIYGTTFWGGTQGNGVVYKLTPHGSGYSAAVLHSFTGGADGFLPEGQLLLQSGGRLYGTAALGGGGCHGIGCGTVFELKRSGNGYKFRVLTDFRNPRRGAEPQQTNLLADSSGALYGTTRSGGTETGCSDGGPGGALGCGVVFKIVP